MKISKDYKNYDYISVSVKEKQAEELEQTYAAFSWECVTREEHKRYSDIVNYTFRRPHKIKNKDELQFLQVAAEEELNARDKRERNKHARSTAFGLIFGIAGVALILSGLALAVQLGGAGAIVCGILLALAGIAACVCFAFASIKIFKKENAEYEIKTEKSVETSRELLLKAKSLAGETENELCKTE